MYFGGRTDLACEALELEKLQQLQRHGIHTDFERLEGLEVFSVEISSAEGAQRLGKPQGRYYTLELEQGFHYGKEQLSRSAMAISALLRRCLPQPLPDSVLVAALGNPDITPDAIGPLAAANVLVTRHLKQRGVSGFEGFASTMLCRTGVLGTTGLESAAQIAALCREARPAAVIAIDALAGTDASRLCRSVQICDCGISPGSGVGNDRQELSRATLGVPVVALGMPTVIDAASLCEGQAVESMFVTPRDIDSLVRSAGKLLGYGINLALHPGLSLEDMELLLG